MRVQHGGAICGWSVLYVSGWSRLYLVGLAYIYSDSPQFSA
jgi:hypothetical protein